MQGVPAEAARTGACRRSGRSSSTRPSSRAAPARTGPAGWSRAPGARRTGGTGRGPGGTGCVLQAPAEPRHAVAGAAPRCPVRDGCGSAVGGLQAEVRPVVGGDELDGLRVLLDVVPDERAVGEHREAALPGGARERPRRAPSRRPGRRRPGRPRCAGGSSRRRRRDSWPDPTTRSPSRISNRPRLGDVHHRRVHRCRPPSVPRRRCRSPTCPSTVTPCDPATPHSVSTSQLWICFTDGLVTGLTCGSARERGVATRKTFRARVGTVRSPFSGGCSTCGCSMRLLRESTGQELA